MHMHLYGGWFGVAPVVTPFVASTKLSYVKPH